MAEGRLTERSALDGLRLVVADGIARLAEAAPRSRHVLRADKTTAAALGPALGVTLPARINWSERSGARAALKLGPDEWLILCEIDAAAGWTGALEAVFAGAPHALVDVSHRQAGLILEGPEVEGVLAAGCPLPLHIAAFPVGRATRTLFAKAEIILWRTALHRFEMETGRSFAPYLAAYLGEVIAAEVALARLGTR